MKIIVQGNNNFHQVPDDNVKQAYAKLMLYALRPTTLKYVNTRLKKLRH